MAIALAVPLAEAKTTLRIEQSDSSLDALISLTIRGITRECEHHIGRALVHQQWRLSLDAIGDAIRLEQVLINLLRNALDAIRDKPVKRLEIRIYPEQSRWLISVADSGGGIDEQHMANIFDPFFTTKSVGKGTGMGLPITYQIVTEKHGGKLDCFSIPGEGTEFVIQILVQQQIRDAV